MQVHVHYFEDGNLQLQSSKAVPAAGSGSALRFSSEADLGAQLVKFIQVGTEEISIYED